MYIYVDVCVCVVCVHVYISVVIVTIKDGVEEAGKISDYAHCVYMYMKHGGTYGHGTSMAGAAG